MEAIENQNKACRESGQHSNYESVILEDVSCPLGCDKLDDIVLTGIDRLNKLPGRFRVVKCRHCGHLRTSPRPTADSIGYYYPESYQPYLATKVDFSRPSQTSFIKRRLKPIIKRFFNSNSHFLPTLPTGRLLEVGCASGAFMHHMASQGWQAEGIEFSEKAAHAAGQLGYKVYSGALETAPAPDKPYDLIVGWMVFEHLHDPMACLNKLHDWAKPDAWLVLSVPNADSLEFRIFQDKWYDLHLPAHLHHFTPRTLVKTLQAGGWQVVKLHHQRMLSGALGSAAYWLEDKGYFKSAVILRQIAGSGLIGFYLLFPFGWMLSLFGQTGRMTIWARKSQLDSSCRPRPEALRPVNLS